MKFSLDDFCGTSVNTAHPFSAGEWTYAANGHIAVRVPRIPSVTREYHRDISLLLEIFEGHSSVQLYPAVFPALPGSPAKKSKECPECEGRGTEHDCPSCHCECEYCEGTGKIDHIVERSININGVPFNLEYVLMMSRLDELKIQDGPISNGALLFTFSGGQGAVMSLRRPYDDHLAKPVTLMRGE